LSIIKLSQLKTILNYALQFRLQKKVINFVENGGTITKAAHTFGIGRASIYRWLSRPKLSATKVKSRQRKLDWKELKKRCKTKSRVEHCQTELKNLELINQLYFML
jgi:transposase